MSLVGVHVALSVERVLEVRLVVLATAVGAAVEMIQIAAGTYRFTSGTVNDALPPPWLLAMWAQFATTFRFSLRSVVTRGRYIAVLFGAAGVPIASSLGSGWVRSPPALTARAEPASPFYPWAIALVFFSAWCSGFAPERGADYSMREE